MVFCEFFFEITILFKTFIVSAENLILKRLRKFS